MNCKTRPLRSVALTKIDRVSSGYDVTVRGFSLEASAFLRFITVACLNSKSAHYYDVDQNYELSHCCISRLLMASLLLVWFLSSF